MSKSGVSIAVPVRELFDAAGLRLCGPVSWGEAVPERGPGVYVVALTCPEASAIEAILPPSYVAENGYWREGQTILYVGRSRRSLRRRHRCDKPVH